MFLKSVLRKKNNKKKQDQISSFQVWCFSGVDLLSGPLLPVYWIGQAAAEIHVWGREPRILSGQLWHWWRSIFSFDSHVCQLLCRNNVWTVHLGRKQVGIQLGPQPQTHVVAEEPEPVWCKQKTLSNHEVSWILIKFKRCETHSSLFLAKPTG